MDLKDYKWVSCSQEMSWSASQQRHLIVKGGLTTLCGHSASHPEVWRGNSTKPDCANCVKNSKPVTEKKEKPVKELDENQTKYLMLMTEQARRLRIAAENIQLSLAEDTLAALEPDAEVWPGIPSAEVLQDLQKSHAKLDLLISQRGMFFPSNFDATAADMKARRELFTAALTGTWKP